jgi:fluoroacetyl-CoA thioesterase
MNGQPAGPQAGVTGDVSFEVTDAMVPGHVAARVLSTPSLVSLIEQVCRRSILASLEAGQDTVGIHICVSHEGVALAGENVRVRCHLSEVDGRQLGFEVSVDGPRGTVSRGTHRRQIVKASRFGRFDGDAPTPGSTA